MYRKLSVIIDWARYGEIGHAYTGLSRLPFTLFIKLELDFVLTETGHGRRWTYIEMTSLHIGLPFLIYTVKSLGTVINITSGPRTTTIS